MLPGIQPIQQPSTLLLPALAFRKDNKLNLHVYERDLDVKLGTVREHTGSFTQFQFAPLSEDKPPNDDGKENKTTKNDPNDFDSIWSSL